MKKFEAGQLVYFTRDIKTLRGRKVIVPAGEPVLLLEVHAYVYPSRPRYYKITIRYKNHVGEYRFIPNRMKHYKNKMGNLLYGKKRNIRANNQKH